MSYDLLKVSHILVLTAWVGLEIAVFIMFFRHRDADISMEGRRALAEVHEPIAFGPRVFWIPMLMLGIALASAGHWGFTGPWGSALVVALAIVGTFWLAGQSYAFWVLRNLPKTAPHLGRVGAIDVVDTWLRVGLVVGLAVVGVTSLLAQTPIQVGWLSWKVILVAGMGLLTLAWKWVGKRIAVERRIAVGLNPAQPSTDERFAALTRLTYQAQVLLVSFWVLMVVIVWLAVAKP